ncbi:G2/M phase-specific E3 ubiquitin-protein ligase isoform X3 [Excalfactoria chinensis]|uniref:G2/M phase-specific E3 ubiquitin-protein ligase isoform X3 n=1 Tax=Excalfactoria chinensis TaxID=46218 RepID=UPI003B3AA5C7
MSENNFDIQSPPCVLCGWTDNCPEKYGEKRTYVEYNLTLHNYCLLMSSGIWQRGEEDEGVDGFLVEDIRKEVNRAARLMCNICRKKGASIGCVAPKCKRSYHFPCGLQKECVFQFMEDFRSYCWEHKPVQIFSDNESREPSQCTICLDLVEHLPLYSVLRSPCCKNTWFHRECLQYQALSAGIFFFRCAVCNNKDKFQKEMLRMGIHIPEKDASWELEDNAYQDLLQCYQHCDVRRCLCRNGRDYNKPDRHLRMKREEASNILKELTQQITTKTTRLNINTENIWKSALKGFRQRNFRPTNTIEVKFTNCKNRIKTDSLIGSKHLFFQLLMLHIQNSSLFEGSSAKNLLVDPQALKENLYFEAGKMIAVSLVHGGPSPGFFSKTLFDCLVYGPENVKPNLDDVADAGVMQTIKKIKYSESLSSLQSTVHDCYDFLAAAGCLRPITALGDKDLLVNDLLIHHVIKRIISPLESFRQGLKTLGLLEKMEMYPDAFSSLFCQKPEKLSAEALSDLFTIHCSPDVNEVGGADFWTGYLQDVESGESIVTLQDILFFATGCFSIPPIGFDPKPTVKFLPVHYPIGNRLLNCLELPITRTYENFKNKMEFTIRNTLRGVRE